MIAIKRVYEPKSPGDGYRVLVDRLWPRGFSKADAAWDLWLKDIGPSNELRKWFNHDPAKWSDFQKKYGAELKHKQELLDQLRDLEKKNGKLTLLFSAHDQEHNQAVVVAKRLK